MSEDNLIKAKTLITEKLTPRYLDEYFLRLYSFSNENLSGYLRSNNYHNTNALTVGSSADQLLNLVNYHCQDITVLDINPFTEYYFELKKAAIFGLNRQDFLNFFTNHNSLFKRFNPTFKYSIYEHFSKYLNEDVKQFWDYLFNNYDPLLIKQKLFMASELPKKTLISNNDYLQDDNFTSLRKKLEHTNIIFKVDELMTRKQTYSQYDYVILSNVFDYLFNITVKTEPEIAELLKSDYLRLLFELTNLLKDNGTMYFQYLWDSTNIENYYYYLFEAIFKNYPNISKLNISSSSNIPNQIDSVYIYKKTLNK